MYNIKQNNTLGLNFSYNWSASHEFETHKSCYKFWLHQKF